MGELVEAARVVDVITGFDEQVRQLKLAISYSLEQIPDCKRILRGCKSKSAEVLQSEGCIFYKEEAYTYVFMRN